MKNKKGFDLSEHEMCINCIHSNDLSADGLIICRKHGIKNPDDCCRHFEIDLLSIRPKKLRTLTSTLTEEDFKL